MLIVKRGGVNYNGMTRPGIEPQFPRPLANTLRCTKIKKKKIYVDFKYAFHKANSTVNLPGDFKK